MDYATGLLFKAYYDELFREAEAERLVRSVARSSKDSEPVPRTRRRTGRFGLRARTT